MVTTIQQTDTYRQALCLNQGVYPLDSSPF